MIAPYAHLLLSLWCNEGRAETLLWFVDRGEPLLPAWCGTSCLVFPCQLPVPTQPHPAPPSPGHAAFLQATRRLLPANSWASHLMNTRCAPSFVLTRLLPWLGTWRAGYAASAPVAFFGASKNEERVRRGGELQRLTTCAMPGCMHAHYPEGGFPIVSMPAHFFPAGVDVCHWALPTDLRATAQLHVQLFCPNASPTEPLRVVYRGACLPEVLDFGAYCFGSLAVFFCYNLASLAADFGLLRPPGLGHAGTAAPRVVLCLRSAFGLSSQALNALGRPEQVLRLESSHSIVVGCRRRQVAFFPRLQAPATLRSSAALEQEEGFSQASVQLCIRQRCSMLTVQAVVLVAAGWQFAESSHPSMSHIVLHVFATAMLQAWLPCHHLTFHMCCLPEASNMQPAFLVAFLRRTLSRPRCRPGCAAAAWHPRASSDTLRIPSLNWSLISGRCAGGMPAVNLHSVLNVALGMPFIPSRNWWPTSAIRDAAQVGCRLSPFTSVLT